MKSPNILLIESSDDHATILASFLKRRFMSLNLFYATNGQQGLEVLAAHAVDVLLWGWIATEQNFKSILELLKTEYPALPIIILGSRIDEELVKQTFLLGAQEYLIKEGLTAELLARSLRAAVERKILEFKLQHFSLCPLPVEKEWEQRVAARTSALTQSEQQYRSLVHFAPVGIVTLSQQGRIIYANSKFRRMFAFGRRDLQNLAFPSLIFQEDLAWFTSNLRQLLKPGARFYRHTLRLLDRHKVKKWCRVMISAAKDATGNFCHFLCLIDDLSERKIQEQLEKEKRIAELASEAKTSFLTNISHEIRTPLAAITGFIDLIISQNSDPHLVPPLDIVKRNANHLISLMNDLLDLSKIDTGQFDINVSEFILSEEVSTVLSTVRAMAKEKCLKLKVKYKGMQPLKIHSDPQKFRQILINLINNAIKYTEKGQILVTFNIQAGEDGQKAFLIVTILDTGIGIAKNSVPCLFKPFMRGDDARVLDKQGLGIGLALSRNLARRLGGDITLIETGSQGSKFRLTLEIGKMENLAFINCQHKKARGEANNFAPKGGQASARFYNKLAGTAILVAEDALDMQLLIRHYLAMAGATVTVCANGEEAIRLASSRHFDAILMDIQMPKVNGYEATRCLKGQAYSGKIIALTAHAFREERDYCIALGFDGFLTKPIVADELISTLVAQTQGRQAPGGHAQAQIQTLSQPLGQAAKKTRSFPKAHPAEGLPEDIVGDPIIREAAQRFFASFDDKVATFSHALESSDWSTVARLAHQIKGSSGSLGFSKLAAIAHELEDHAKGSQDRKKGFTLVKELALLSKLARESLQTLPL